MAEADSKETGQKFGSLVDKAEAKRVERLALAVSARSPPWAAKYLQMAAPVVGVGVSAMETIAPYVWKFGCGVYSVYQWLPHRAAKCLAGFGVCFFGGRYAVSIAAIQAFQSTGGGQMIAWLDDLRQEFKKFYQANIEDDKRDDDKDGVADVDQLTNNQLAWRKTKLWLKVADPEKIQLAMSGLYSGWMGVLVVLKFEFAKTAALAHSIGDHLRPLTGKVVGPVLVHLTPEEYRQWVSPVINVMCKSMATFVAWKIQELISTVQSGIQGGHMIANELYGLVRDRGWIKTPIDETILDDVLAWGIASVGIYTQIFKGGIVPFPFTIVMWPLDILEWWIRWQVTWLKEPKEVSNKGAGTA